MIASVSTLARSSGTTNPSNNENLRITCSPSQFFAALLQLLADPFARLLEAVGGGLGALLHATLRRLCALLEAAFRGLRAPLDAVLRRLCTLLDAALGGLGALLDAALGRLRA